MMASIVLHTKQVNEIDEDLSIPVIFTPNESKFARKLES